MENYQCANFSIMEDPCPGSNFNILQCKFCGHVSPKVANRDSYPTCPPCYTAHTPDPLVTIYTQPSSGENNLFTESNVCMSDDSVEEDLSNPRHVIDESATDVTMESDEESSADAIDSAGYLGESEESETDESTDIDSLVDMVSSDDEELVDDCACIEVEASEEPEREDSEDRHARLKVNSVSEPSISQEVNEKCYTLSSDTDTLSSQKRNRSNSVSEDEEKAAKKMKPSILSSFEKDVSPAFERVSEDDLIGKDNNIIGSEVSIHRSPTENQVEWNNEEGDHVMFDGVHHFASQEKNAIAEGAFIDLISRKHDDIGNETLKSPNSSSDEGFISEKSSLPKWSHSSDRVSPDFFSVLPDSAASTDHGSDAESMEEKSSFAGYHTDAGVDGDMSSSDAESNSYGSCFTFTKIKFRFEIQHAPQDIDGHNEDREHHVQSGPDNFHCSIM